MKTLLELKNSSPVKIHSFDAGEEFKRKMMSMGILPGKLIKRTKISSHGPIIIEIDRTEIAIGRGMAKRIIVTNASEQILESSQTDLDISINSEQDRDIDILLIGQPNVGKSVLFSHITGTNVVASNYHGSTVSFTQGELAYKNKIYKVVDAPGTYSLEPIDDASKVAVDLIDRTKRIINLLDATHLERSLTLTYELLAQGVPILVVLNMMDEAKKQGIEIDLDKLSEKLNVPVLGIIARQGIGIKAVIDEVFNIPEATIPPLDPATHPAHHPHIPRDLGKLSHNKHIHLNRQDIAFRVSDTIKEVQKLSSHKELSLKDRLSSWTTHPVYGFLFAVAFLMFAFIFTRLLGEFLIGGNVILWGTEPLVHLPFGMEKLFELVWTPFLQWLSTVLGPTTFWHNLLIGKLINGEIDYYQSFGALSSGIFIPIGAVLPYIFSFYLVLSLLEDSGYLPRLAIFLDKLMHKVGLHGYAIIPVLLGFGCNVPGILATRVLSSKKQRFIASTLIATTVPCASLQAMIWGLLGHFGGLYIVAVYAFLFFIWFLSGLTLKYIIKLPNPELLIEMPPYRLPQKKAIIMKLKMRLLGFLKEALPIVVGTILVVNALYELDVFNYLAKLFAPVLSYLWGLPSETIVPLFVGFLRKDIGAGLLATMNLGAGSLFTAVIVLTLFFPCIATMTILFKELGVKYGFYSLFFMIFIVLFSGVLSRLLVGFI